jgi:hypothetical protein
MQGVLRDVRQFLRRSLFLFGEYLYDDHNDARGDIEIGHVHDTGPCRAYPEVKEVDDALVQDPVDQVAEPSRHEDAGEDFIVCIPGLVPHRPIDHAERHGDGDDDQEQPPEERRQIAPEREEGPRIPHELEHDQLAQKADRRLVFKECYSELLDDLIDRDQADRERGPCGKFRDLIPAESAQASTPLERPPNNSVQEVIR